MRKRDGSLQLLSETRTGQPDLTNRPLLSKESKGRPAASRRELRLKVVTVALYATRHQGLVRKSQLGTG